MKDESSQFKFPLTFPLELEKMSKQLLVSTDTPPPPVHYPQPLDTIPSPPSSPAAASCLIGLTESLHQLILNYSEDMSHWDNIWKALM